MPDDREAYPKGKQSLEAWKTLDTGIASIATLLRNDILRKC